MKRKGRIFNTSGDCRLQIHYMVNITERLEKIKAMVDAGQYFTINRARQFGKTTTLKALEEFLKDDYIVISMDFQMLSASKFRNENVFSIAFARKFIKAADLNKNLTLESLYPLQKMLETNREEFELTELFEALSDVCKEASCPIILMIDEVDSASDNQVFLDFLSQLRGYYIRRDSIPTFQSVILAGVYDIKNIRRKLCPGEDSKINSPWNIAADFLIDMSFSEADIAGMLIEYEADHHTGMDVGLIARLIYEYTSGYPFLVSRICKIVDERVNGSEGFEDRSSAWTREGFLKAVRILLEETNMLFDSLIHKLRDYPELDKMLRDLLFKGKEIAYVIGIPSLEEALMFGFARVSENQLVIANRIFESLLYNLYLASPQMQQEQIYDVAWKDRNQFIENGRLNMKLVLERFVTHFDDLYGDRGQRFYEEDGRRYFMLFLKPIINGRGNCYVEAETRNRERTDLIVDYHGERFIVEVKLWYGQARHEQGEVQLAEYLRHYHMKRGYLLVFNFNKTKETGVREVECEEMILVEAVV